MPSVTSCTLDRTTLEVSVDEVNVGTYTLRYIVETDGTLGPQAVANGALSASPHNLPTLWETWTSVTAGIFGAGETDTLARARRYNINRDPLVANRWYIVVTFLPPDPGEAAIASSGNGTPIKSVANPFNREPVYWWDREVFTFLVYYDKDGKEIVNTCGDLYPDVIEGERTRGVLVVEYDVATLAEVITLTKTYDGAVNSTVWTLPGIGTQPERSVLCREVSSGPPTSEQGYTYYHVTFRFAIANKTPFGAENWDETRIERGYGYFKASQSSFTGLVEDEDGHPKRYFLEDGGTTALAANGTRLPWNTTPIVTSWRVRREVDFNQLPWLV